MRTTSPTRINPAMLRRQPIGDSCRSPQETEAGVWHRPRGGPSVKNYVQTDCGKTTPRSSIQMQLTRDWGIWLQKLLSGYEAKLAVMRHSETCLPKKQRRRLRTAASRYANDQEWNFLKDTRNIKRTRRATLSWCKSKGRQGKHHLAQRIGARVSMKSAPTGMTEKAAAMREC